MQSRCVLLRSFMAVLLLAGGLVGGAWPALTQATTTLRVGVADMPPDVYLDAQGRMSGIFGTLLREIATREGWTLSPRACDWSRCLQLLQAGELDLLPNVAYTAERARHLAYHQTPVLFRTSQIYTLAGDSVATVAQLAHKRVAVLAGSVQEGMMRVALARSAPGAELVPVASLAQGFERVRRGEADAAVADVSVGITIAPRYQLVPSSIALPATTLFYAAPLGHEADVLADIDRYLNIWKADPGSIYFRVLARQEPERLAAHWLSQWLAALLAGLLLVLAAAAVAVYWRRRLRFRRLQEVKTQLDSALTGLAEQVYAHPQVEGATFSDTLTDLPNRSVAVTRIEQAIALARSDGSLGGVIVLNLDGFRKINDVHGMVAGDAVLREVASRLLYGTRVGAVVSRTNSDEFTVLLALGVTDLDRGAVRAMHVAENLRHALTEVPVPAAGHLRVLRLSIGVALLHQASANAEMVLREASMALREARAKGGNCSVLFDERLGGQALRRLTLESDLPAALQTSAFSVHLQPQYAYDDTVTGAELLARWQHPVYGAVRPSEFIPLAREAGQLHALTLRVLARACDLLARLKSLGETYPVSINVSSEVLADPLFVQRVQETLARWDACAGRLMFEVTEEIRIANMATIVQHMHDLRAAGVLFSMDDFGMDYANLGYLAQLPLHELKIDKSLVDEVPDKAENVAIVRLILTLARRLGLRVVGEGVESATQAHFLFAHRCDAIQGYFKCRPMPIDAWLECRAQRDPARSGKVGDAHPASQYPVADRGSAGQWPG